MLENGSNKQKSKSKESFSGRKKKSNGKTLADLIKQINQMSEKAKAQTENPWQPEPPLAA